MSQSDTGISLDPLSRRRKPLLNGVPLVALFGVQSSGSVKCSVRTMLRVAPSATSARSIMYRGRMVSQGSDPRALKARDECSGATFSIVRIERLAVDRRLTPEQCKRWHHVTRGRIRS